jgi:hypothetical protein
LATTEYCSELSLAAGEPIFGTASLAQRWALIEAAGPWDYDPFSSPGFPSGSAVWVERLKVSGYRVILIRKRIRKGSQTTMFLARSTFGATQLATACVDDLAELHELDVDGWAEGRTVSGVAALDEPVILVCTHGRHDLCCSIKGNAVARSLEEELGDHVWEASHVGGDRFAPNVVVLPFGAFFGRLPVEAAPSILSAYLGGTIDLDHYRGRSCFAFSVQAAEHHLRRNLGLFGVDDLKPLERRIEGDLRTILFEDRAARRYAVSMRVSKGAPRRLTCSASREAAPNVFELVEIDEDP